MREWRVIGAGANAEAQALLGQRVGMFGGEMYAGYRASRRNNVWRLTIPSPQSRPHPVSSTR